jgi:hypothetical protein
MKLTDILRQINEEEEQDNSTTGPKQLYDPAVEPVSPSSIQDIVDALTDINNYDRTLKTKFAIRDGGNSGKEAFPKKTNPNELLRQAKEEWVKLSEDGKLRKIKNIKNRIFVQTVSDPNSPGGSSHESNYAGKKAWEENIINNDDVQDAYNDWENEGNEGSIEDYLASLTFDGLKNTGLLGSKGINYWPQKPYTKDQEIALNQATMREGENFIVTQDKVIFPFESNRSFLGTQGEQGLKGIVNSILKTAGVKYNTGKGVDVVRGTTSSVPSTSNEPTSTPQQANTSSATFKITLDPKKVRGNTNAVKNMIAGLKNTYDKNFDYSKNVLTITNIKPEKKIDLIKFFAPYKQTELTEEVDFEMRRMLVRAGIIK